MRAARRYYTNKLGINWIVSDDLRLRSTRQTVIRDANIGEFANPVFSIPFANLRTVARLFPRYAGDPCVGATNSATITQCTAQRSEERRVGKECVSTCRSRWSPYH